MKNCPICCRQLSLIARLSEKKYCSDCKLRFPEVIEELEKGEIEKPTVLGSYIPTRAIALSAFKPGKPIANPDMFRGRRVSVCELVDALRQFLLAGILGERGYGKTSTMLMVQKLLRGSPTLSNRYGSVQWRVKTMRIESPKGFGNDLNKAACELLPDNVPEMLDSRQEEHCFEIDLKSFGIPVKYRTITRERWREIKSEIEKRLSKNPRESFMRVIKMLNTTGIRAIVFIDEADKMTSDEIRELAQLIKDCETFKICFCICGILESLSPFYRTHQSLGRQYREVRLTPFTKDEVKEVFDYANQKLEIYVKFSEEVVQQIASISFGIPPIVHQLGYESLLTTVGENWTNFASQCRATGPIMISSETVNKVVKKSSNWLPNHSEVLKDFERSRKEFIKVLYEVANCDDFSIAEDRLRGICSGIGITQENLNSLLQLPDIKTLKQVRDYSGRSFIKFDDPVLAWLVLTQYAHSQIQPYAV